MASTTRKLKSAYQLAKSCVQFAAHIQRIAEDHLRKLVGGRQYVDEITQDLSRRFQRGDAILEECASVIDSDVIERLRYALVNTDGVLTKKELGNISTLTTHELAIAAVQSVVFCLPFGESLFPEWMGNDAMEFGKWIKSFPATMQAEVLNVVLKNLSGLPCLQVQTLVAELIRERMLASRLVQDLRQSTAASEPPRKPSSLISNDQDQDGETKSDSIIPPERQTTPMTMAEAGRFAGFTKTTGNSKKTSNKCGAAIRRRMDRGQLKFKKVGRRFVFDMEEMKKLAEVNMHRVK